MGAILAAPIGWVCLACGAIGLVFSLLDLRTGFAARNARVAEKVDALRYRGLYPAKGEGSDDDVKRLKAAGEKGVAFRLYLELHAVPLKQAWRDFKAL